MNKNEVVKHEFVKKHGAKLKPIRGRGLNKHHLELELLLENGKKFTIAELAQYQGCEYRRSITRLKTLCRERGYEMTQVGRARTHNLGYPAKLFVLTKIDGES